jgi:hypothetical protein
MRYPGRAYELFVRHGLFMRKLLHIELNLLQLSPMCFTAYRAIHGGGRYNTLSLSLSRGWGCQEHLMEKPLDCHAWCRPCGMSTRQEGSLGI